MVCQVNGFKSCSDVKLVSFLGVSLSRCLHCSPTSFQPGMYSMNVVNDCSVKNRVKPKVLMFLCRITFPSFSSSSSSSSSSFSTPSSSHEFHLLVSPFHPLLLSRLHLVHPGSSFFIFGQSVTINIIDWIFSLN